ALADAGRAEEEHVIAGAHEGSGGEHLELAAVGPGLERPVEGLQRLAGGESRELEAGGDAALSLAFDLALEHVVEEAERREVLATGLLDQLRQALGRMGEAERAAAVRGGIEVHLHAGGAHRTASTRAA